MSKWYTQPPLMLLWSALTSSSTVIGICQDSSLYHTKVFFAQQSVYSKGTLNRIELSLLILHLYLQRFQLFGYISIIFDNFQYMYVPSISASILFTIFQISLELIPVLNIATQSLQLSFACRKILVANVLFLFHSILS